MRAADLERPDLLVMDLDPGPGVSFGRVAATALALRERLDALGLAPFLRVTGGKGLHVVTPLERGPGWEEVRGFAHDLATHFARRDPDAFTATLSKDRRENRILVDWVRNTRKSTAIATWSTRAKPGAPVAVPLAWSELDPGAPAPPVFGLREAIERPDPWVGFASAARPITKEMRTSLAPRRR
jgi:bifunctional non-homologous end joining protein LigD